MLATKNFTCDRSLLPGKCQEFWREFINVAKPLKCSGNLDHIDIIREIRFYDTADFVLYHNDYIFRERKGSQNRKKEVTLKFRHHDRYVAEDRDMLPKKIGKGSRKFEEDIKTRFQILYSYSSSLSCKEKQQFESLKDISRLYPGIVNDIADFNTVEKLQLVNSLSVQEIIIKGAEILLCESPEIKAESALIIWYDLDTDKVEPIIVEFSFRYGNQKKERYVRRASQNAYDLFLAIQQKMNEWCEPGNNTKTGFLYKK